MASKDTPYAREHSPAQHRVPLSFNIEPPLGSSGAPPASQARDVTLKCGLPTLARPETQ